MGVVQGAYALLEEGNEDQSNAFCEDDIDKIMATRTHRIVMDGGGRSANWLTKKGGKVAKKVFQVCLNTQLRHECRSPALRLTKKNVLVGLSAAGRRVSASRWT